MTAPHNGPYGTGDPYQPAPGPYGPPPPRRTNPAAIVAAAVVTLVVAGLVVTLLLVKGGDDSGGSSSAPPQGQQGSGTATGPSPGSSDDTGPLGTARGAAGHALGAFETGQEVGFFQCEQDHADPGRGVPEGFRDGLRSHTVNDPKQVSEHEVRVHIAADTENGTSYSGTLVVVEENAWKACFSAPGTHIEKT